jgi:hypothetical protein
MTLDEIGIGPGPQAIAIPAGWYATPADVESALEGAIGAIWGGADVDAPTLALQTWYITLGVGVFDLVWLSDDLREYMGFTGDLTGAASYTSDGTVGSSWYPETPFQAMTIRRHTSRRTVSDHTGWTRASVVGRHREASVTAWIEQDEADTARAVLLRFLGGGRGTLRFRAANSNPWAWSAAGWDGELIVSLAEPSKRLDLSQYATRPWAGIAQVQLDFIGWV